MTTGTALTGDGQGKKKSFVRFIPAIVRTLMGLAFLVFGLNGFLNFIPQPKDPMPPGVMAFIGALMGTGYMMPLIFGTQLVVGLMLVTNCFVPLALVLIAPFLVNSILFHIFLEHSGLPMAGIFVALELYLVWAYRYWYRQLFTVFAKPGVP